MASAWGTWVPSKDANRRFRLRIDYTVAVSGTVATVSGAIVIEAGYAITDITNSLRVWGSLGVQVNGPRAINVFASGAQVLQSFKQTVGLTNVEQVRTIDAALSGIDSVGDSLEARCQAYINLPKSPVAIADVPNTPWDVEVIRHSDTRHEIRWTVTEPGNKPITDVIIQRWARRSTVGFQAIAVIPGAAGTRAFIDNGTRENNWYTWRIITRNGLGSAPPADSPNVPTTPAAPSNIKIRRDQSGVPVVQWDRNAPLVVRHDIQVRTSADGRTWGAWGDARKGLPDSASSSGIPDIAEHLYLQARVQAIVDPETSWGVVASAPSSTLPPLQPPLAPQLLAPVAVVSSATPVALAWRHRTVDGSAQRAAEIQYRLQGTTDWTLLTVEGGEQQTETVSTLTAGMYEWQARTRGAASLWGPWSPITPIDVADPPQTSFLEPASPYRSNRMAVVYTYSDDRAPMTGYIAQLWAGETLLQELTGDGSPSRIRFPYPLTNSTEYRVVLVVISGTGLRSAPAEITVTTDWLLPPQPVLTVDWLEQEGRAQISSEIGGPATDQVVAVSQRIERSIDAGQTWRTIADGLPLQAALDDRLVPLETAALWRAVAVSGWGVEHATDPVALTTVSEWVWLGLEDGRSLVLQQGIDVSHSLGHTRTLETYLGDELPTVYWGRARPATVSASAALVEGRGLEADLRPLLGRTVYYRDPSGFAAYVVLDESGINTSQNRRPIRRVSIKGDVVGYE